MVDPIHVDLAVAGLGAAGCAAYFTFVFLQRGGSSAARAELFLFGLLALLLAARLPFWWYESPAAGRVVFAFATLLPLAITLYCEQVVRRHHPLWLKVLAAGASAGFFLFNAVTGLATSTPGLLAFMSMFVVVLGANGVMLARESRAAGEHEAAVARALIFAAVLALPLAVTDFREQIAGVPVRLGSIGPLVLIYALLTAESSGRLSVPLGVRVASLVACSAVLAGVFALVSVGPGAALAEAAIRGLPVAAAWVLLSAIVARMFALHAESRAGSFLRWLVHARLDSVEGFLTSLRHLPLAAGYLALRGPDLEGYRMGGLANLPEARRGPLSVAAARTWIARGERLDEAEQLVHLLERHDMTHALLVRAEPPLVLLLQLPQATDRYVGEARAAVIQRIARRLAGQGE